jgi:cytochrome c oxidase cbb3-type subunit 2
MRYGEYSKAGEFAYDRPFLWGSKRTGPDLARIGGKYPDQWHYSHFENAQAFFAKSNMPSYGWLKNGRLDAVDIEARMKVNGFPYAREELDALAGKNELDALVAYMQVIGIAVAKKPQPAPAAVEEKNPRAGDAGAVREGKELYTQNCEACHGDEGKGSIGPSLRDREWLKKQGDISDGQLYGIIAAGTDAGMPGYDSLGKDKVWALVSYIRSVAEK